YIHISYEPIIFLNGTVVILNNKINFKEAQLIILKSVAISRITKKFDKARLLSHLEGYCINHFNDKQVDDFYKYLVALSSAMSFNRRTPSEVKRENESYIW
ncbi:MAG: hypothetical protein ACOYO1_19995, partial [Bacteroidales bacterium]